ncbi:MAG: glucose-6-phosphate isomerase, partial [Clostridia bacterium]|nr:glucose-6-phosphate isomerase [Clostridia bacterium]
GCDIEALMYGAARAEKELTDPDIAQNDCYRYAAARHLMMEKSCMAELLVCTEPRFAQFGEWWKQLFGESEGKNGKGLFPATAVFSTDLHSLGQFLQQGTPMLFETALFFDYPVTTLGVYSMEDNFDGLNYLSGKTLHEINQTALRSALISHADGGRPSLILHLPIATEEYLGYLFYFFEKACAISAYMLGVNPFDQPGVEGYKKNMFALLGRRGFENRRAVLEARLGER